MTKTNELAEQEANKMCCVTVDERIIAKLAFEFGSNSMLERVCEYLKSEHPTWYEHFGEELKKAMEE